MSLKVVAPIGKQFAFSALYECMPSREGRRFAFSMRFTDRDDDLIAMS